MKKRFLTQSFAILTLLLISGMGVSTARAQGQGNGQQDGGGQGQSFDQRKGVILDKINDRIKLLENVKDCVKKANDPQSLRACKPNQQDQGQGAPQNDRGPSEDDDD